MSINQDINQNNERAEISQELKWDLTALYPPFDAAIGEINKIMDEVEAILDKTSNSLEGK